MEGVTVIIPSSVKKIGEFSFYGVKIDELIFEEGVTEILPYAFYNTGLSGQLQLPDSLVEIGMMAFASNDLEQVDLNSNTIFNEGGGIISFGTVDSKTQINKR